MNAAHPDTAAEHEIATPPAGSPPVASASTHTGRTGGATDPAQPALVKRQALLLTAGCLAAACLSGVLWNSTRAHSLTLDLRRARAATLAADAQAVSRLRQRPRQATETGLRRSDLLARVSRAMQAAGLDPASLASTLPQPPRRVPGSAHAEVLHRLMLEAIELEALVRFCHALAQDNPELRVAALQLRAGNEPTLWNADVSVSYWVLVPENTR